MFSRARQVKLFICTWKCRHSYTFIQNEANSNFVLSVTSICQNLLFSVNALSITKGGDASVMKQIGVVYIVLFLQFSRTQKYSDTHITFHYDQTTANHC